MITATIKFESAEHIKEFVNIVKNCDAVDIKRGKTLLDGKSIQGLFALPLNTEVTCSLQGKVTDNDSIISKLHGYVVSPFREV